LAMCHIFSCSEDGCGIERPICHRTLVCCTRQASRQQPSQQRPTIKSSNSIAQQLESFNMARRYSTRLRNNQTATTMTGGKNDKTHQPTDAHDEHLKIRIPRWAWNSYELQTQAQHTSSRSTSGTHNEIDSKLKSSAHENPYTQPKNCRVKLWMFHYGGAKRVTRGALQHEIVYEGPCLQFTCPNCWKWHLHLMRDQYAP
jgi:hypothetical protein